MVGQRKRELLREMLANSFTVFLTIENNLSFQNNFVKYPIDVIVLLAHDNTYETITEFFDQIPDCIQADFTNPKIVAHPISRYNHYLKRVF